MGKMKQLAIDQENADLRQIEDWSDDIEASAGTAVLSRIPNAKQQNIQLRERVNALEDKLRYIANQMCKHVPRNRPIAHDYYTGVCDGLDQKADIIRDAIGTEFWE